MVSNSNSAYPVANRKLVCAASLGNVRAFQAQTCGTGGTIVVAGDMLKARVAVANYDSAHSMNCSARVWLSADATLSEDDVMPSTEFNLHTGGPIVLAKLNVEVPPGDAGNAMLVACAPSAPNDDHWARRCCLYEGGP